VLRPGQFETLHFVTDPADISPNELEIWYDGADEFIIRIDPPGGGGPVVPLGAQAPLIVGDQVVGRVYHRAHDPNNGDNHLDAFLLPQAGAGTWTVTVVARRAASGRFEAWIERDEVCKHCQARFTTTDSDPTCTTGTIANGRVSLVVGAYDPGLPSPRVAAFSSSGPTRDGRQKPDIGAPGEVLAARSAPPGSVRSPGGLVRKRGTSMATPHVTGAVALCLEAGRFDARQIRELVLDSTAPSGDDPERRMGCGYLDIAGLARALQTSVTRTTHQSERKNRRMDRRTDSQSIHSPTRSCRTRARISESSSTGQRRSSTIVVQTPQVQPTCRASSGCAGSSSVSSPRAAARTWRS